MLKENFQLSLWYQRRLKGLTQSELGQRLGVSGQTIYKYEKGITFPPVDVLEKILDYFNIDANELFGIYVA